MPVSDKRKETDHHPNAVTPAVLPPVSWVLELRSNAEAGTLRKVPASSILCAVLPVVAQRVGQALSPANPYVPPPKARPQVSTRISNGAAAPLAGESRLAGESACPTLCTYSVFRVPHYTSRQ